jgi:cellulose biosynthesis protein BcsQ
MASPPHIIAVVSGKGGVSKTVFSANLAAIAATASPTVLVDLDFPNQGLSGLFVEKHQGWMPISARSHRINQSGCRAANLQAERQLILYSGV